MKKSSEVESRFSLSLNWKDAPSSPVPLPHSPYPTIPPTLKAKDRVDAGDDVPFLITKTKMEESEESSTEVTNRRVLGIFFENHEVSV